jgi:AraC-like DNA-binding protein
MARTRFRWPIRQRFQWRLVGNQLVVGTRLVEADVRNGMYSPLDGEHAFAQLWPPATSTTHMVGNAVYSGGTFVMTVQVRGGRFRLKWNEGQPSVLMVLISEGAATLHSESGHSTMSPGHGVVIFPGDDLTCVFSPDTRLVIAACPLSVLDPEHVAARVAPTLVNPTGSLAEPIRDFATALVRIEVGTPLSAYLTDQLIGEMLLGTVLASIGVGHINRRNHSDRYAVAMAMIGARFMDPKFGLNALAESLSISPRRLQAIFAERDHTVGQAIRDRRAQEARTLLASQGYNMLTIEEIAQLTGFSNAHQLRRVFRVAGTMSPSRSRRSLADTERSSDRPEH